MSEQRPDNTDGGTAAPTPKGLSFTFVRLLACMAFMGGVFAVTRELETAAFIPIVVSMTAFAIMLLIGGR